MSTPQHKPIRKGEGSSIRFDAQEVEALYESLRGRDEPIYHALRGRLRDAADAAEHDRIGWAGHLLVDVPLSAGRLAMRGWILVSDPNETAELYMRNGDFLREEEKGSGDRRDMSVVGWRYGMPGAFGNDVGAVRDAWQACIFSRRRNSWIMVEGEPDSHEKRLEAGAVAMSTAMPAFRKGRFGEPVQGGSYRDTIRGFDHYHYEAPNQHGEVAHRGPMEALGSIDGDRTNLVRGTAIVKIVRGYFETTQKDRYHPTFDIGTIVDAGGYTHQGRTGPFWCDMGPAWSIYTTGRPASHHLGARRGLIQRQEANFPVFATKDEAIAYAATLPRGVIDRQIPTVTPVPMPTFTDIRTEHGFSWAS